MKKQKQQFFILILCLVILLVGYYALQRYNAYQASLPQEDAAEPFLGVSSEEIIEFSYVYDGETYSFVKEEDTWKSAEDTSLNIDQTKTGNMVSKISQLAAETVIEAVEDMSVYGLDEPERTITFATADVSARIEIGDYNSMQSVYYLRVDDGTTVYAVESTSLTSFSYTLEDLIVEEEEEEEEATDEDAVDEEASEEAVDEDAVDEEVSEEVADEDAE